MGRFLVDEDLPRSLVTTLRAGGAFAEDVRDVGLRGGADDDVIAHAVAHDPTLLTGDLDFANLLRFPLGTHRGIVVARLPHPWPAARRTQIIADAVRDLPGQVVLVLQGGGALGSYQAGVYQALHEAGVEVVYAEFPRSDHFTVADWATAGPWTQTFLERHLRPEE